MSPTTETIQIFRYDNGELAYYMEHRHLVAELVHTALLWLRNGLEQQGWQNLLEPYQRIEHVLDEFHLILVGETLVAFSVLEPWFMQGQVIAEEFIAPLTDNPAPIADVVDALTAAGKAAGCTMLTLGTRANTRQRGLAHLFEQTGARLSTMELVKEIPRE